jgi:hypothetical protein
MGVTTLLPFTKTIATTTSNVTTSSAFTAASQSLKETLPH